MKKEKKKKEQDNIKEGRKAAPDPTALYVISKGRPNR